MHWLRFATIALISFFAVISSLFSSDVFFHRALAVNSHSIETAFSDPDSSVIAQLNLPGFHIPGLGSSLNQLLNQNVNHQLLKAFGKTIASEAPIVSSAQVIFPTVDSLPGDQFSPTGDNQQIFEQIRTSTDGSVMLEPGDYLIPVDVFCMKHSASSPPGHQYLLAPLKGKMADVITALNSRAVGSGIPHSQLQVLSWNLQAGMKYEEITPQLRTIVDQLLPDFKPRLHKSFYEQIQTTWNQLSRSVSGVPSFDSAINQLGDVGRAINALRQTRETLLRYGNDYEALSRSFVRSNTATQVNGALDTPWSQINDRVYARLVTKGNFATPAQLQLRVVPSSVSINNSGFLVTSTQLVVKPDHRHPLIAASSARAEISSLVADPQNLGIQPLSMSLNAGSERWPVLAYVTDKDLTQGFIYQLLLNNSSFILPLTDLSNPEGAKIRSRLEKLKHGSVPFQWGRGAADLAGIAQALLEILGGGGTAAGGGAVTATGVGAAVGVPAIATGWAEILHGATVAGASVQDLNNLISYVFQSNGSQDVSSTPSGESQPSNQNQSSPSDIDLKTPPTYASENIQTQWGNWPLKTRQQYLEVQAKINTSSALVRRMSDTEYQAIFGQGRGTVEDVFKSGTENNRVFSIDREYQFSNKVRNTGPGYERVVKIPLTDSLKTFLKENLVPDNLPGGLKGGLRTNPRFKFEEGGYNIVIPKSRWNEFRSLIQNHAVKIDKYQISNSE